MRALQIFVWDWATSFNMLAGSVAVIVSLTFAAMWWGPPGVARLIVVFAPLQVPIIALEVCFGARLRNGEEVRVHERF